VRILWTQYFDLNLKGIVMSIETVSVKRGMVIVLDGVLNRIVDTEFRKPGKGRAHMTLKMKNMRTGSIVAKRFSPDDKVELAHIDKLQMEYLYKESDGYVFMDTETYDQITIDTNYIGDDILYLLPNAQVQVQMYDSQIVGVELPVTVELEVTETDPALKGATVQAQTKPATMETGLIIQVPSFISPGEVVQVDTSEGRYVGRVSNK
jgi:elongation factor P